MVREEKTAMEMPGIETRASYMRRKHSTIELHPHDLGGWGGVTK